MSNLVSLAYIIAEIGVFIQTVGYRAIDFAGVSSIRLCVYYLWYLSRILLSVT